MRQPLMFSLALLMVSCSSSITEPEVPLDQPFILRFGEAAQVSDTLTVRFVEVREDSRCPSDVLCAWMGNGQIRLEVRSAGANTSVLLNTHGGESYPQEATAFGHSIRLLELQPYPKSTDQLEPSRYSARLMVSRV